MNKIKELEELAKKFIIGYVPYNEKQCQLIDSIMRMEEEKNELMSKIRRYDTIIKLLYLELSGEGEE